MTVWKRTTEPRRMRHMIRCFNLVIFLGVLAGVRAQEPGEPFHVAGIRGKVISKQSKRALTYDDKVDSRDTLEVQEKNYYIALVNSDGMYELNPAAGKSNGAGWKEFALSVSNSLSSIEYLNSEIRGEIDEGVAITRTFHPGDIVAEFRILLLDSEWVAVDRTGYPDGKNNSFGWRPAGSSDKITSIRAKGDTLLLTKSGFQAGKNEVVRYDLYFQQADAEENIHSQRITDFGIVFLSPSEATVLIDHFLQAYPGGASSNEKDIESQLLVLLTRYYQAAPRGILLSRLIKKKVKKYLKNKQS